MTLSEATRGYWLLALKHRGQLPFYELSREDQVRVSFAWTLRKELLLALDDMPAHLAERVICESARW